MVNGIYYSQMPQRGFMWALVDGKDPHPAHFGSSSGALEIVNRFYWDADWTYSKPNKSYMIMPEGMYKW